MSVAAPIAACPGCVAAPQAVANIPAQAGEVTLHLPSIHCAACIGTIERGLAAMPGVRAARVNLSRKRVVIDAPSVPVDQLVQAIAGLGYEAQPLDAQMMQAVETDPEGRKLLTKLAVAGFAMMNVMLFSVAVWSGAAEATRILFHWLSALIAVPTLIYSAQVFFGSAWRALRVARLNMDVPISLAIILACGLSIYETAQGSEQVYFDAALSLTFFLLIGRYLDHRTRIAARSAAQELSALELPWATRITPDGPQAVAVTDLRPGDDVIIASGMRAPVDGEIIKGATQMDRSFLTGESLAIDAGPGTQIAAGEVNLGAAITLRATAVGEDTTLRRMIAMVETAEGAKNRYTALADRAAQVYAPLVHLLAFATFVGWFVVSGDVAKAMNIAIAVLIITCPCALGLAVPAVMTAAAGRLFRHGLLVKDATAIERLAEVDTVIFDKTGTLTEGHARIDPTVLSTQDQAILAALASQSQHPVSRAITAAMPVDVRPAELTEVTETAGQGISALWQGRIVRLGRGAWVGAANSPALKIGDAAPIVLPMSETLRDGAEDAVAALTQRGLAVSILSGDAPAPVDKIAQVLGVPARSELSPDDKCTVIRDQTASGKNVLMVGDGLNDTAALALAHASISPASALDASRAASDVVLLGRSLREVPLAIATSKSARLRVLENFAIAAGYNMIAVPLAIAGIATPLTAAIAMSLSSITVLLNALRLR